MPDVEPYPCPVHGETHQMEEAEKPKVFNEGDEDITFDYGTGFTQHFECSCGVHVVCTGQPHYSNPEPLGYYFYDSDIIQEYDNFEEYAVQIYQSDIRYTNSTTLENYNF